MNYTAYNQRNLPFRQVNHMGQDHLGYVWIGSSQGLFRFNGSTLENFSATLKSKHIKHFAYYNDSTLIFSNDRGVHKIQYHYDGVRIRALFLTESEAAPNLRYPNKLFVDSSKQLWISQPNNEISRCNQNQCETYTLSRIYENLGSEQYSVIREDRYGNIWAATQNGVLYQFSDRVNRFIEKQRFPELRAMLIKDKTIWLAGQNLHKVQPDAKGTIKKVQTFNAEPGFITAMNTDLNGRIYVGTNGNGLYRMQIGGSTPVFDKVYGGNNTNQIEDLPFGRIQTLVFTPHAIGSGGSVWIGTDKGYWLLQNNYFREIKNLPASNVFALGNAVIGDVLVSFGEVHRLHYEEGDIKENGVSGLERVTAMATHKTKEWFGTSDGRIIAWENGVRQQNWDLSERGGAMLYFFADKKGRLWFTQAPGEKPLSGIGRINTDGTLKIFGREDGFRDLLLTISQGPRGEIYAAGIGRRQYLFEYDEPSDGFIDRSLKLPLNENLTIEIYDLAISDMGLVWMATSAGLLKYDTERVQKIDLGEYSNLEMRAVVAMPEERVWIATATKGLLFYKKGHYVSFTEEAGLPSSVLNYRCLMIDKFNKLWVATSEGVVCTNNSNPIPAPTPPPSFLKTSSSDQNKEGSIEKALRLAKGKNTEIPFQSIAYPGQNIMYQYRIINTIKTESEPIIPPWMTLENTVAPITAHESGKYQLDLRARQNGGYAWSEIKSKSLDFYTPWYLRLWVRLLLGVCFLSLAAYYIRRWLLIRFKKLEGTIKEKEEQLAKTDKELGDKNTRLQDAMGDIDMLFGIIKSLPDFPDWKQVQQVLAVNLNKLEGLISFTLSELQGNEIYNRSYFKSKNKFEENHHEFDEKNNLVSWVIVNKRPLMLNNFDKEMGLYVQKSKSAYKSALLIPFHTLEGRKMAIGIYSNQKESFFESDFITMQILARHLKGITKGTLKV